FAEAHAVEEGGVVWAPLADLDEEPEVDLGPQERLDLAAGGGADRLQHRPAPADEDALLALALDEDRGLDAHERLPLLEAVDDDGGGIGDLLAGLAEDLLADHLGDEEALGLVGEEVLGIERRALRQVRDQALGDE